MGSSEWVAHLASFVFYGSLFGALGCGVAGVMKLRSDLYAAAGLSAIPVTFYLFAGIGIWKWLGAAFILSAFVAWLLATRRQHRWARATMLLGLVLAFATVFTLATTPPVVTESEFQMIIGPSDRIP